MSRSIPGEPCRAGRSGQVHISLTPAPAQTRASTSLPAHSLPHSFSPPVSPPPHHTWQPVWRRRYSGHQHHHQSPSCQSASTWLASCPTPHSPSSPLLTTNRHTAVIIIFTNFLNSQSSYLIVILKGSFSTFFH